MVLQCAESLSSDPTKTPKPDAETWTAPAPLSPRESLKTIIVPEGFAVELVAAEPLVMDPVAFAWGPDMRLWVVEMADYNWLPINDKSDKKPKGRVVCLTDTDGDGKYDKRTVFLDNLDYPTGVLPWRKGVLVTAAPDILYAEDTTPDDKNDKADKIDKLYTGFIEGNPQLRVNGLQWGLDNWIYCANGLSNGVVKSNKTGQTVDIRGRDIRIRPDTGEIEPASGASQFGRVRDDYGNWFGVDNSRLIIHYVLEDHHLRRNPHVAAPEPFIDLVMPRNPPCYPIGKKVERLHAPYMANRFTSACGIAVYRDNYLGDDVYGQVFVCEPVHNLITRRTLTPDGVTFKAERVAGEEQKEFLASTDEWFRPVHLRTGPDGALWIADMYRAVVEHPQWLPKDFNKKVDWMQGSDKGRIYRVVKKNAKPKKLEPLEKLDAKRLLATLNSDNGAVRDLGHMKLIWDGARVTVDLARDYLDAPLFALGVGKGYEHFHPGRLHALAVIDAFASLHHEDVDQQINLTREGRDVAALCRFYRGDRRGSAPRGVEDAFDHPLASGKHKSDVATIALVIASAMGDYDRPSAGDVLLGLLSKHPGDPYVRAAVLSSARSHVGQLSRASTLVPPLPPEFFDSIVATAVGDGDPKVIAELIHAIVELSHDEAWAASYRRISALLQAMESRRWSLAKLREIVGEAGKRDLDELMAAFRLAHRDVARGDPARFEAVKLLGRGEHDLKEAVVLLLSQLGKPDLSDWYLAVLVALNRLNHAWDPAELPDQIWKQPSPTVRAALIDMLLRRDAWTPGLLDAIETNKLAVAHLSSAQRQALLQHKKEAVQARAAKLFESPSTRAAVLKSHRDVLTTTGDPARGQPLFERTCAVCHKIAGVGKGFGPDLGALSDRSPQALLTAILDPNQAVDPRYLNYVAETTDGAGGETFTGVLLSETASGVTLVGADGVKRTILRKDLATLRSTSLSLMPEGLEQGLGKQGLADVIAFVASRSQPARVLPGVKASLIKPNSDGSLVLPATACEAFGKTITYESEDNNLGMWSNADDFAAWQIAPAAGGKYEVWLDYASDKIWTKNTATISAESDEGHAATLVAKIESTGTFNDYQQVKVGVIELAGGPQRLIIRPLAPLTGKLMDLRGVRLEPVKQ